MAFTKTVADADNYYAPNNDSRAWTWAAFGSMDRTGAFAQAKRQIEMYLNRDLQDPASGDTTKYRDDYAVFEQTLWILERQIRRKEPGDNTTIDLNMKPQEGEDGTRENVGLSDLAIGYLKLSVLKMVRG